MLKCKVIIHFSELSCGGRAQGHSLNFSHSFFTPLSPQCCMHDRLSLVAGFKNRTIKRRNNRINFMRGGERNGERPQANSETYTFYHIKSWASERKQGGFNYSWLHVIKKATRVGTKYSDIIQATSGVRHEEMRGKNQVQSEKTGNACTEVNFNPIHYYAHSQLPLQTSLKLKQH